MNVQIILGMVYILHSRVGQLRIHVNIIFLQCPVCRLPIDSIIQQFWA